MYSSNIENFLDFLKEVQQDYNIALSIEEETNAETQDLLHNLELNQNSYHDMAKAAKVLKEVRQKRRQAKDIQLRSVCIINWIEDNNKIIKGIERLLGDVRKAEKIIENRGYLPKTDIVESRLNKYFNQE